MQICCFLTSAIKLLIVPFLMTLVPNAMEGGGDSLETLFTSGRPISQSLAHSALTFGRSYFRSPSLMPLLRTEVVRPYTPFVPLLQLRPLQDMGLSIETGSISFWTNTQSGLGDFVGPYINERNPIFNERNPIFSEIETLSELPEVEVPPVRMLDSPLAEITLDDTVDNPAEDSEALTSRRSELINNFQKIVSHDTFPRELERCIQQEVIAQDFTVLTDQFLAFLLRGQRMKKWSPQEKWILKMAEMGLRLVRGEHAFRGAPIPTHAISRRVDYQHFTKAGLPSPQKLVEVLYRLLRDYTPDIEKYIQEWLLKNAADKRIWRHVRSKLSGLPGASYVSGQRSVILALQADIARDKPMTRELIKFLKRETKKLPLPSRYAARLIRQWHDYEMRYKKDVFTPLIEALFMTMRGHNERLMNPYEAPSPACAEGCWLNLLKAFGEASFAEDMAKDVAESFQILDCA